MPASAYLRAAASQLRTATANLQQEIRTIQSETDRSKWQLSHDISSAENERATLRMELVATDDRVRKSEIESRLQELNQLTTTKKQELSQRDGDAARTMQSKIGMMSDLQGKAAELESLAGSIR